MIDIIFIILKLLIFTAISFIFGWLSIERFLKEKSLAFKIGGSFLFGFSFYTLLLNLISYLIPIQISFYLIILLFLIFILLNWQLLIEQAGRIKRLNFKRCLNPVFITAVVFFLSVFWIGLGFFHEDLLPAHAPTAVTIAGGNFPIVNVSYPVVGFSYHYASDLLAAAIYKITGLSVLFGYKFLFAFFTSLIFVFGFIFSHRLTKNSKTAYWGSLIMMLACGFYFVYAIFGFKPLYAKFILQQDIEAPFSFFSSVLGAHREYLTEPLIHAAGNHSLAFAWGFLLALAIFCLFLEFFNEEKKKWFPRVVIISILFGFLALSSEVLFVVLMFVFGFYLLLTFISKKLTTKQRICGLFIILFIGGVIAAFQGGLLKQFSIHDFNKTNKWIFNPSTKITFGVSNPISLFSLAILEAFGLCIIFLPLVIFYWRKKRDILLLILLPALILFSAPFMVEYIDVGGHGLPVRFLTFALAFLGLFTGLYLGDLLDKYSTKKIIIYFLILIIVLNGLIYYAFDLFYPVISAYRHNHSMLAMPLSPSQAEKKAYNWIKQNTGIKDIFLVKRQVPDLAIYKDKYGEEEGYQFIENKFDFVTYTGRLIIEAPWCEYPKGQRWCDSLGPEYLESVSNALAQLEEVKQTCEADILQQLRVKFLYIEVNHFPDFEQECLQNNNLELKFEAKGNGEFIRIYKIN